MMTKRIAAAIAAGTLLLSAAPALALDPSLFANVLNRNDARKEKSEMILERKLENRIESEEKKAKKILELKKDNMKKDRNTDANQNYLRGVKRGWVKQLSRFDECVDDAAAGKALTQRCEALTEFRKLLDECKRLKDAGTAPTEQCRKVAKQQTDWPKSKSSSSTSASSVTSGTTNSAGSTTSTGTSTSSAASSIR